MPAAMWRRKPLKSNQTPDAMESPFRMHPERLAGLTACARSNRHRACHMPCRHTAARYRKTWQGQAHDPRRSDRMAALVIRAIDQDPVHPGCAHFGKGDLLEPVDH